MSDTILGKQGIDPRVVKLATQFKADQGPELQQMQSWSSQWVSLRIDEPRHGDARDVAR